jgi:hypothetical protein
MFKGGKYKIQQEYYSLAQFTYHLFSNRNSQVTETYLPVIGMAVAGLITCTGY